MLKEYNRIQRISQQLKKELAIILQREISDSYLGIMTISKVEVSRNLAHAKVFVTFLDINNEQRPENFLSTLESHKVHIRMMLAKRIRLRLIPEIRFIYDDTLLKSTRTSNMIDKAVNEDKRKQHKIKNM
ncbi:ribosome-binding factor A [Candidatus Photodesmus blepharus]|uniref:Ribosome-binding factor A n=1 Tax=Candidatus Photodesmus blepharonis TaxID=1179155 RepID=A0A084CP68_9GAMM|nr:30S ribosome-binding factor RbfA [Candidatus Photodesmus blepharus]KEY91597.1 ribosome-binding factor A [Candidatus Photodesmus blepharus]